MRRAALAAALVLATVGSGGLSTSTSAAPLTPAAAGATNQAPSSVTIVIGQGAKSKGYQTPNVTMAQGGALSVVNFDSIEHTVTSRETDANGNPLFSVFSEPGSTTSIPQASSLAAGTYHFYCLFHQVVMKGTLTIEGSGGGGVTPVTPKFEQPLFIPPVLTDAHIRIPVKRAAVQVLPHGAKTEMWTYGGTYPGPTIIRPAGHDTKVTYVNRLPKKAGSLTVHFHGDHHKSKFDGRPTTQLIRQGDRRTYDFPLTDGGKPEPAAFNFYHDHRMGRTSRNNWFGLQGMFLTTDKFSRNLPLPSGKYDVPLLVANRGFTDDNQLTDPFPRHPQEAVTGPTAPPGDGTVGAQVLANGRFAPYLKVSTHRYRLRLLNGSNFTPYNFQLSDGRPFVQIGTGDGLLPKPVIRSSILLGPAQRADVIVDFHRELHKRVLLQSVPRTDTTSKDDLNSPSVSIMQFRVTRQASSDHTRIPSTLRKPPAIDAPTKVTKVWKFGLGGDSTSGTFWTVNGKPFDPARSDLNVPIGSTETWVLKNVSDTTHFIHLHEELWHTIARNGKRPPSWERGLEDTWKLDPGETVKVAAKFTDYPGKFMIHCHMLDHEDHGLMTQFDVIKPGSRGSSRGSMRMGAMTTYAAVPHLVHAWAVVFPTSLFGTSPARATGFAGLTARQLKKLMCKLEADSEHVT